MTHTPGPWSRFEGKGEVYIVAPDSSVVAIVSPLVDEGCFWPNAYILHASLDLLKACEQAKTLLDALRLDNDVGELLSETQRYAFRCVDEQLQAAIDKAKGG